MRGLLLASEVWSGWKISGAATLSARKHIFVSNYSLNFTNSFPPFHILDTFSRFQWDKTAFMEFLFWLVRSYEATVAQFNFWRKACGGLYCIDWTHFAGLKPLLWQDIWPTLLPSIANLKTFLHNAMSRFRGGHFCLDPIGPYLWAFLCWKSLDTEIMSDTILSCWNAAK